MRLDGVQLGHYRLTHFIRGGGMGEVYQAEDLNLPRQVAIKVMRTEAMLYPDAESSKDATRLFKREMRTISMLDHSHILTLLEAGEERISGENIAYMVMPYCSEGSLVDWIRQHHSSSPLTPQEVLVLLEQAAEALQYAHDQQVLHLDIKPSNFLVRRQSNTAALPNLLLADFGVAKISSTSRMSATPRGTFDYMAPEQLAGNAVAASDQYALGIMAYELLTGRTPFQGAMPQVVFYQHANVVPDPPSTLNAAVPKELDKVVLRALAKKPQERYGSVTAFAQAFAAMLNKSTVRPMETRQFSVTKTMPESKIPVAVFPKTPAEAAQPLPPKPAGLVKPPLPKRGVMWAILSGVVAAILMRLSFISVYDYLHIYISPLIIYTAITVVAAFVTGRIAVARSRGLITGITIAITFYLIEWFVYHFFLSPASLLIETAIFLLFGFLGAWLATIRHPYYRK